MKNLYDEVDMRYHKIIPDNKVTEQSYLGKIKYVYKNQGSKELLKQLLKKITSPIFKTNSAIWFERDLTQEIIEYKPKIPVEIDFNSTIQTIGWLKSQKQSWLVHPKEIATALKYSHYWACAKNKRKIIGSIKIGFENVFIVDYNRIIQFPDKMAFIYDTYVLEDKRGKGIGKYLIAQATKFLKAKGFTKVGCHIPTWNNASIKAYKQIGFEKVSDIRFFRIFGIPIRKVRPIKKKSKFLEV